jgi:biotin carboxylase
MTMTIKYVLFLNLRGIAAEQQKALSAARDCGFEIILLAEKLPAQFGELIAVFEQAKSNDEDALFNQAIQLSKKYAISGVFSWTDTDVVLSAKISKALGLLGPNEEAVYLSKNKYEMRKKVFEKYPDLVPTFIEISQPSDIGNNLNVIKFPAVIKPISCSGSKGIFIVNNRAEAQDALNQLIKLSSHQNDSWLYTRYGNKYIFEEYVAGQEFSVEGFVYDGKCYIAGITDKKTTYPWCLEYRHIFPAAYKEDTKLAIEDATKKIVSALALDYCPIHLEAKWTNNGLKLIEIAARTGGDLIHSHLIENSLGINWMRTIIDAVGNRKKPILTTNTQNSIGIQFILANKEQIFSGLNADESVHSIPGIISIQEIVPHGSMTTLPPNDFGAQRVAYVMVEADSFDNAEHVLDLVVGKISI